MTLLVFLRPGTPLSSCHRLHTFRYHCACPLGFPSSLLGAMPLLYAKASPLCVLDLITSCFLRTLFLQLSPLLSWIFNFPLTTSFSNKHVNVLPTLRTTNAPPDCTLLPVSTLLFSCHRRQNLLKALWPHVAISQHHFCYFVLDLSASLAITPFLKPLSSLGFGNMLLLGFPSVSKGTTLLISLSVLNL